MGGRLEMIAEQREQVYAAIADYLGLVGDTADGFPGLPVWGAKSASTLLARYGHIEEIPADAADWDVIICRPGRDPFAAVAEGLTGSGDATEILDQKTVADAAQEEGVQISYLAAPVRILGEGGKVVGMECVRMELGKLDASGRRRPVPIEGSEFVIDADVIVPAISQRPDISFLPDDTELEISRWDSFVIDSNGATNVPGIHAIGDREAEQALLTGDVDAAFFVAAPDAPLVQRLLHSNGVRLMNFSRALAYTRLHPYLSTITLPEGIIDLQANIPPEDITLLAPAANLVADENFHPALVSLLLQAATAIHGEGSLLDEPGSFPNTRNLDFPLDDDARRFFRHGPPFLQRYLPFWTANLIDRMKIMLIPLLTLLVPLFKVMPPAYRWRVRRKIYRWYVELRALDVAGPEKLDTEQLQQLLQKLDRIEFDVRKVSVPLSYTDELYDLRQHIGLVRDRLHGTRGQEAVAADDHGLA